MYLCIASGCTATYYCYENDRNGNYDEAIKECTREINGETKLKPIEYAYNNRGTAYHAKGKFDLALLDYNSAIKLNPYYSNAYNNRGLVYAAKGQFNLAAADFNKAIELNPKYAAAYNNSGKAYYAKGDNDKAIAEFSRAVDLNPVYGSAYLNRGDAYRAKNDLDKAIADYNKAIEIHATDYDALASRGLLFQGQHKYEQAINDYTRAIDANPRSERLYLYLMIATWLSKGNSHEVLEKIKHQMSSNRDSKWIHMISNYYIGSATIHELNILEEAHKGKSDKEVNERLCEAYFYLGARRLISGDRNGAEEYFTKSLKTSVFHLREYGASRAMLVQMGEGVL